MGNRNSRKPHGSEKDLQLLPIDSLIGKHSNIENLIFQDGRSRAYAYTGAVKVLEKLGILRKIKRFSGVGTGAIVATLLACRFNCEHTQLLLFQLLDELLVGDPTNYANFKPRLVRRLGWKSSDKLYDMIGRILRCRFSTADLTFTQLYDQTSIELCVIVTNVNAMRAEYWHRKTAPDMSIREAVYMSLSLPGMFCPKLSSKYNEVPKSVYLTGSLLCNNPVHTYDGWWLSMYPEDDFFSRWSSIPRTWSDEDRFDEWNPKSLGFVLLNKLDEKVYPEFYDRLTKAGAKFTIPDTEVGMMYKESLKLHKQIEMIYETVHKATKKLVLIIEDCFDFETPFEKSLAERIAAKNCPLSDKEQQLLFSKHLTTVEECIEVFRGIAGGPYLSPAMLVAHIQKLTMSILDDYRSRIGVEVNDMGSYLGAVVQTMNANTSKISEKDCKRTVGIFYGHVNNNTLLEPGDQTFLFKQGWNATVAYLQERGNHQEFAFRINSTSSD